MVKETKKRPGVKEKVNYPPELVAKLEKIFLDNRLLIEERDRDNILEYARLGHTCVPDLIKIIIHDEADCDIEDIWKLLQGKDGFKTFEKIVQLVKDLKKIRQEFKDFISSQIPHPRLL